MSRYTPTQYFVRLNRLTQFPLDMLRYADSEPIDETNQKLIDRLVVPFTEDDKADLPERVQIGLNAPLRPDLRRHPALELVRRRGGVCPRSGDRRHRAGGAGAHLRQEPS